jgi:hypothetical protein
MSKRSSVRRGDDIANQLMELKGVTQQTGTVHEAQAFQLKLWGLLALSNVRKADLEVAVGLPHLEGDNAVKMYRVEYRATSSAKPPKDLKKRLEALDRSVKWLLGDHFELTVRMDGKAIFVRKGARQKKQNVKRLLDRLKNDDTDE